jgi:hypothetical protein
MLKRSNPIRPPQSAVTAKAPSLSIGGTLRDAATREPLQSLLVRTFYLEPQRRSRGVGTATTR